MYAPVCNHTEIDGVWLFHRYSLILVRNFWCFHILSTPGCISLWFFNISMEHGPFIDDPKNNAIKWLKCRSPTLPFKLPEGSSSRWVWSVGATQNSLSSGWWIVLIQQCMHNVRIRLLTSVSSLKSNKNVY